MSHIINDHPIIKFEGGVAIIYTSLPFWFRQTVAAPSLLHTLKKRLCKFIGYCLLVAALHAYYADFITQLYSSLLMTNVYTASTVW